MKSFLLSVAVSIGTGALGLAAPAWAQVEEMRVGANIHDIDWSGLGNGGDKERSVALNAGIVFAESDILKWALSPQPYIGGALNLGGETSYGGAGLLWRQTFGDRVYFDYAFGLVAHDGTLEAEASELVQRVASANGMADLTTAEAQQFLADLEDFRFRQRNEIDFGSRILFQNEFALGLRVSDGLSVQAFVTHLSHGRILAPNAPNEGLDTLGFRVARHF
ncbi:MAG: acyloxyacyl hydrolase [Litorimonas sp.]